MKKYEYIIRKYASYNNEGELNRLGKEGWLLIHIRPPEENNRLDWFKYTFAREIPDTD